MNIAILHGRAVPQEQSPTLHIPYTFVDILTEAASGFVVHAGMELAPGVRITLCRYDAVARHWELFYVHAEKCQPDNSGFRIELQPDPQQGRGRRADLEFLMCSPLLEVISQQSFLAFVNSLEKRCYAPGEVLVVQGDVHPNLFLIQSGICDAAIENQGQKHHVAELKAGELAGEMPVLTGGPSDMHITARSETVAWAMDCASFDRLAQDNPDLRIFLTEALTRRIESCPVEAERIIGKYVIRRKLGAGGWGMVYLGEHTHLHLPVAVKMLKHTMSLEPLFSETFRREAQIIASLSHENIVRVYDVEEAYRTLFIIMEYLEGESLQDLLQRRRRLPPETTQQILAQVLLGLEHAHQQGIVHRDVKPDNIWLCSGGNVKILDFGLACPPGTEDMSLAGTVYYAPPEQIEGDPVDSRADIYSVGIMAYEMLCGQRPYPEDDLAQLMDLRCEQDIPDPALLVPDLPAHLRDFILSSAARDSQQRHASAAEALQALTAGCMPEPEQSQRMRAVYLRHETRHAVAIDALLEEFSHRARELGASLQLVELKELWERQ